MFKIGTSAIKDLTKNLVSDITSAGWEQISSNTTNDFLAAGNDGYILRSPKHGKGSFNTILRLKEYFDFSQIINSDSASSGYGYVVSLLTDYTPSSSQNTNGTIKSTIIANPNFFISRPTISGFFNNPDTLIEYYLRIENSYLMIMFQHKTVDNGATTYPVLFFAGAPTNNEDYQSTGYRNQFLFSTNFSVTGVYIAEKPFSPTTTNFTCDIKANMPSTNPNLINEFVLTPVYYTSGTLGTLGFSDAFFLLPSTNIYNNQELIVKGKKYKVFSINQATGATGNHYNPLPSSYIAIKIEE